MKSLKTDEELRRAERAVKTGGAAARVKYARLLGRAGHAADEVLHALLPALERKSVRAELRAMAKEKRSLGVSRATIDRLLPSVKLAEVQEYLIAYANQGTLAAQEMLDSLVHGARAIGVLPGMNEIELACRGVLGMSMYDVVAFLRGDRHGLSDLVHEVFDRRTGKRIMKFEGLVGEPTQEGEPSVPVGGDVKVELDPDGKHVVVHDAAGNARRVPIGKN